MITGEGKGDRPTLCIHMDGASKEERVMLLEALSESFQIRKEDWGVYLYETSSYWFIRKSYLKRSPYSLTFSTQLDAGGIVNFLNNHPVTGEYTITTFKELLS